MLYLHYLIKFIILGSNPVDCLLLWPRPAPCDYRRQRRGGRGSIPKSTINSRNLSFVDKVDEDRQALLNLERNIAIIERSMSANQLQSALHKGKRQVRPSQRIA